MKKVLFLMFLLLLMGLGAASVKAQVRIGGNTPPNPAAALDLNAAEGTTTGTKGLALPRVTLGSSTATLDGATTNITGMLVYNTGGSLNTGVYYWSGSLWNRVDDVIGNEFTDTIAGGGLTKRGSGTAADPWTIGIKTNGVTSAMIRDSTVLGSDIAFKTVTLRNLALDVYSVAGTLPAATWSAIAVPYPATCGPNNSWYNLACGGYVSHYITADGKSVTVVNVQSIGTSLSVAAWFYCFH